MQRLFILDAVIPAGFNTAQALDLRGYRVRALTTGAGWTPADITFVITHDGVTGKYLRDSVGAQVKIPGAVADSSYPVGATWFEAAPTVYVVSGTATAPVNQVTQQTVQLICVEDDS